MAVKHRYELVAGRQRPIRDAAIPEVCACGNRGIWPADTTDGGPPQYNCSACGRSYYPSQRRVDFARLRAEGLASRRTGRPPGRKPKGGA